MTDRPTKRLRAVIDANILISMLLNPDAERSAAAAVIVGAAEGLFLAVVPVEAIAEASRIIAAKTWLADRISPNALQHLIAVINRVAEVPPALVGPLPRVSRDSGDDYLLAHAVLAGTDFLVTRDQDLLSLGDVAGVRIVDPAAFLAVLRVQPE